MQIVTDNLNDSAHSIDEIEHYEFALTIISCTKILV